MTFTSSLSESTCGIMLYTVTKNDDTPIDNSIFTWNQATKKLSIYTTNPANVQDYLIKFFVK